MIDTIVVVDTETSGRDPAEGAALLEVAWVVLDRDAQSGAWTMGEHASYLVRHDGEIPPGARGVHHIGPADVGPESAALPSEAVLHSMLAAETPELRWAAHNAAFDSAFLPELARPWICTWRCAMHLFPDSPDHKNMTLRYALAAEPPAELLVGLAPHRALYDSACTAAVLLRMLRVRSAEELVALTSAPVLQSVCRFGKHRGQPWADVPTDYLRWMRHKSDLCAEDADLRHTVDHYLTLRR